MATQTKDIPRRKPRRRRRLMLSIQLLLVAGFVLGLWFSFKGEVLDQRPAPARLGDLKLVHEVKGDEALSEVNKLHGTEIKLVSAAIEHYANDNESSRAIVYVGTAGNTGAAQQLTAMMTDAIKKGRTPFSNVRRAALPEHEVFQVDGPGGMHFYYSSMQVPGSVVWITVEAKNALSILEEAMDTF
ncbi:MAG: hypothetical protein HYX79_09410 [Chloroflexi bacterium]|nr:hypothetical protein [Chloroflexota bacterium]